MKVSRTTIFKILYLVIILMILFTTFSVATNPIDNPEDYKPGNLSDDDAEIITGKANIIFSTISIVGVIVSIITLIILGIKYMMGSVEEKAEYKKTMIPYLIGAFMLFGITIILGIFSTIITGITDNI